MVYRDDEGRFWEAHTEKDGFGGMNTVLDQRIDREALADGIVDFLLADAPPERVRYLRGLQKTAKER